MSEPRQFFAEDNPAQAGLTNRTLYRIPPGQGQDEALILVECVEGTGNVPRNATSFKDIEKKLDLVTQLNAAAGMARLALESTKRLCPGEVEIEFGIELGGEMGIPLITKGEGKANFKLTLTWKDQAGKEHS